LLTVMAGRKWGDNTEAEDVLSAFCVYTAFMAWNGMTEAFVYSAASSGSDMGRLGAVHGAIALVFAGVASVAVSRRGTVGLVLANCFSMSCRAIYSTLFAARFFSMRQNKRFATSLSTLLRDMLPHPTVLLSFATCYIVTAWSHTRMIDKIDSSSILTGSPTWYRVAGEHIIVGASCFVGLVSVAYVAERNYRQSLRKLWSGKSD
jgi:oligosaccharide translocation protein RFT1